MLELCRSAAGVFPPLWLDPDDFCSPLASFSPAMEFHLEYGEALDKMEQGQADMDTESIQAAPVTSGATLTLKL